MKNIKTIITVAAMAITATTASAQNNESGYFVEGNIYRHDLNPAFGNEKNYIAMPVLGNINTNMAGNIGIQDILFNKNGKTTTFLNPLVSKSEFLDGISDNNNIYEDFHMQILGAGFKGFGGYNTVEINVREIAGVQLPGSLLELAKTGLQNKSYDISGLDVSARAWAEIALGHSRQLNDKWRVGAKFKILLGGAAADAKFNNANITLGENGYTANIDGQVDASVKGLSYKMETKSDLKTNDNGNIVAAPDRKYVNDVDVDGTGLNGFGIAFDLGAEYKIDDNWTVSAALRDLGFISWSENHVATSGTNVNTADYVFNTDDDAQNSFDNTMDALVDDFAKVYQLQDQGKNSRTTGIGATMEFAGSYKCNFYDKLTFGLLNTTRLMGAHSWTNFRLSANVAPCKIFSASGTFAVGTYGASLGGVLNLHVTGFNLFLASDHIIGKMAKQGVPLSSNGSVAMGINFPF